MRPSTPRRTVVRFAALVASILVAILTLTPTGATAVPYSLKVSTTDGLVTGSCEFAVTRTNVNPIGPSTYTAKLTMKAAEIKPTFLAPRRVATLVVTCDIYPDGFAYPEELQSYQKVNNASTLYKAQYITTPTAFPTICLNVTYVLRTGEIRSAPPKCNPPLPPQ